MKYIYDEKIKEKTLWNWCIINNRTDILDSFYYCEKNDQNIPKQRGPLTKEKAFWHCKNCNGIYETEIYIKVKGYNCPYCSNTKVLPGFNDLETKVPEISKEYSLKNPKLPSEIYYRSSEKVLWECGKCGNEWVTNPKSRVGKRSGCPSCWNSRQTSFPELVIFYYCKKVYKNVIHKSKEFGVELDIYIPEIRTAIEYDGVRWHRGKRNDENKDKICKKYDIRLIRIRGVGLEKTSYAEIINVEENDKGLENGLKKLEQLLKCDFCINIVEDTSEIYSFRKQEEYENSILSLGDDIEKKWDYEKNYPLRPENFPSQSNKTMWWKCDKGHRYKQKIMHKYAGRGCPICAGKKVAVGDNDFLSNYPEHAAMWDYEKNNCNPNEITKKSSKNVWWKCDKCGLSFELSPKQKVSKKHKCIHCYWIEKYIGVEEINTGEKYINYKECRKRTHITRDTYKRKIKKGTYRILSFEEKLELYKKAVI